MRYLVILMLLLVFASCEQNEIGPSQGELNAEKLEEIIEKNRLKTFYVYEFSNDEYSEWERRYAWDVVPKFEDGYMSGWDGDDYITYDLSRLLKYNISYSGKVLYLYFN